MAAERHVLPRVSEGNSVSRYFFDVRNTEFSTVDDVGKDCSGPDDVRAEALRILCAIAQDDPLAHLHGRLEAVVHDRNRNVVLTAMVSLSATWLQNAELA